MRTPTVPTILRAAAAAAALAAAVGTGPCAARRPALRVVAVDVSASIHAAPEAEDPAWTEDLAAGDEVCIVVFADGARTVRRGPRAGGDPAVALTGHVRDGASSVAAALRLAGSLRGAAGQAMRLEIVLVTDGRATDAPEELEDAALALRRSGGADLRVVEVPAKRVLPAVRTLRGPGRAAAGEPFALVADGESGPGGGAVELLRQGGIVDVRDVGTGAFRVAFPRIEEAAGTHVWQARLAGSAAPPAASRVVVGKRGAALLLSRTARPEVAGALGGDVVPRVPGPRSAATGGDLAAFDLVVADDLPEEDLAGELLAALRAYARDGGGVLLLGGASSFGAGGWGGRPLDEWSPLRTLPADDAGAVLVLAIDGSGSMDEVWPGGGVRRDAAVRAAASELVRGASAQTRLLLRTFRGSVVPESRAAFELAGDGRDAALSAIAALPQPGGPTALLPPLRDALDAAADRPERRRGVVLLTDGRSSEAETDLRDAIRRLGAAGIGLTIVLPGPQESSGDAVLLRAAEGTAAVVRAAGTPEALAPLLVGAERALRGDEPIAGPARLESVPGAEDVLGAAPLPGSALRRNRVSAAPGARVLVRASDGVPLAAVREDGRGTVAALAARAGDASWIEGGGTELVAALAAAVRRRSALDLRVECDEGGSLLVRPGPAGGDRPTEAIVRRGGEEIGRFPLVAAGAGLLRTDRPLPDGAEVVTVVGEGGATMSAGLDTPAPPEFRSPRRADLARLAALAATPEPASDAAPRWPLCALAAGLLAASAFKWRARPSR